MRTARIEASEGTPAAAGRQAHLDILSDELAGGMRRPFWNRHTALEGEYAARLEQA